MTRSLEDILQERNNEINNIFKLKEEICNKNEITNQKSDIINVITDIIKEKGISEIIYSYNEDLNDNEIEQLKDELKIDELLEEASNFINNSMSF